MLFSRFLALEGGAGGGPGGPGGARGAGGGQGGPGGGQEGRPGLARKVKGVLFSRFLALEGYPPRADTRIQHFRAGVQGAPGGVPRGVPRGRRSRDLGRGLGCSYQMEYRSIPVAQRKLAMGEALHLEAQPSPRLYSTSLQWHHPLSIQ